MAGKQPGREAAGVGVACFGAISGAQNNSPKKLRSKGNRNGWARLFSRLYLDSRLALGRGSAYARAMIFMRTCLALVFLAATLNAAEEKPFMSFNNPPAKPIALETNHVYESAVMGVKVGYNLYLPPGYGDPGNTNRYPVIYWLHGRGRTESNDQFPPATVDAAIRSNVVPPLIFVYVSGGGMSFYSDSVDGKWMSETTIIKELIPHIDATYRTIANRGGRAIQGMSMGGFGAMKLALKYPDLFGSVVAFAGGYRTAEEFQTVEIDREILNHVFGNDIGKFMANHPVTIAKANADAVRDRVAIQMLVGLDDSLLENNRWMHRTLTQLNLQHQYWEIPGVKHDISQISAWIGTAGLQFAASHFYSNTNSFKAQN
jgi:endo-1,4-beta-xylanase